MSQDAKFTIKCNGCQVEQDLKFNDLNYFIDENIEVMGHQERVWIKCRKCGVEVVED